MTNSVLITGVHGFCAKHLVKHLIAHGVDNIYGTDIHSFPPERLGLKYYSKLDLRIKSQVEDTIRNIKPNLVFNLAGITKGSPSEIYETNFLGSVYLLESVSKFASDANVLLVGSAAEYGDVSENELPISETHTCKPYTHYGISKYAMTLAAISYWTEKKIKVIIARPFNIIGTGMPASLVIGAVLARAKEALQINNYPAVVPVGNLQTKRDFIAVEDVCEAYISMIRSDHWGEVFNICSGEPRTTQSVLEELVSFAPRRIALQRDPHLIRPSEVTIIYGSNKKAHNIFGFKPNISISYSLRDLWKSIT
jgi:GDP-4-dehydro-6-deoxy-D-mannose reductase